MSDTMNSTGKADALGVTILFTDTVTISSWGGTVRLSNVGKSGKVHRVNRAGNLVLDCGDGIIITAPPSQVTVARRDGKTGHQGNVGTRFDSHARQA